MGIAELQADLTVAFPPSIRDAVTNEYRKLYRYVASIYEPQQGWDPQAFGFMIYKATVQRLARLAGEIPGLTLVTQAPTFRLQAGRFLVASYRVGSAASEGIQDSFPRNENGAVKHADLNQLSLELSADDAAASAVILAHQGNPLTGLEALYLAVPGATDGVVITSWLHTELVWRRSEEDELPTQPPVGGPAPVPIPDASVRLRLVVDPTPNERKDAQ